MNPQEKLKKIDRTEYGHPRLNLTAFFGQGRGGGGKFRAVPNQANQQHVQNGALRLRGIWIPKKKQTQPWTTHSVQVYLLHMFSWGPESITCVSFKNKIFLRMGS